MHAEDCRRIRDAVATSPPTMNLDINEETRPFGFGEVSPDFNSLDLQALVDIRRRHETQQARTGVRTRTADPSTSEGRDPESLRKKIIRRFNEELKKQQGRGATTGQVRKTHYGTSPVTESMLAEPTGNAANAAAVTSAVAKKVSLSCSLSSNYASHVVVQVAVRRRNIYLKADVPCFDAVAEARVTLNRPIRANDWGFVFTSSGVEVAHGEHASHHLSFTSIHEHDSVSVSPCFVLEDCWQECQAWLCPESLQYQRALKHSSAGI